MPFLYVTEQGAVLRKKGERIIVQKNSENLLEVFCHNLQGVLLFGNIQFTTQVIKELFKNGIELAIFTKTGRLIGQITSPSTKNIELRVSQFKKHNDELFKLNLSKIFVRGKITNYLSLIRIFSYNHQDVDLSNVMSGLESFMTKINSTNTISSLMGVEGIASRMYFEGFSKMILRNFKFNGRKKYPSTDPVNALLSLGYTLIFNEISSLLDGLGFDPYLGYFHGVEYGRASLASDIQEEFRPFIDRFTLYIINNQIIVEYDFYNNPIDGSTYLKKDALKKYFQEYELYLNREFKNNMTGEKVTLRKSFLIQAHKLMNYIKNDTEYIPFKMVD